MPARKPAFVIFLTAALMLLSFVALFRSNVPPQLQQKKQRHLTLNTLTPEMQVMANVGNRQDLHALFLSLDYDETDNTIARISQLQQAYNPHGNLVVMGEGLGPLFPLVRQGSWLDFTTILLSRLSRPIWQGKFLEFPNPDPNTKGNVKFINQYIGLEGWTGHVYPGTIQQATNMKSNANQIQTIVPAQDVVTLDHKPSLIMDYRLGRNWRTNVVDECRPLNYNKLVDAQIDLFLARSTPPEDWDYVWFCRGTVPRFLQLGGERVFFLFFILQIMPETMSFNITI